MPRSRLILRPSFGEIILNYATLAGGILLNIFSRITPRI